MIEILTDKEKRIDDFRRYAGDLLPDKKISILASMGYFSAPASLTHHGQQEGDLYLHSKTVSRLLEEFTENNHLAWERPQSPRIIGLFHDLCKTGEYERKPPASGNGYIRSKDILLPGHGEKSVMMAQQLLKLTGEEILCIRYHMGAYEGKEIWDYLQRAAGQYPNILWTMQADLIASWILQV